MIFLICKFIGEVCEDYVNYLILEENKIFRGLVLLYILDIVFVDGFVERN